MISQPSLDEKQPASRSCMEEDYDNSSRQASNLRDVRFGSLDPRHSQLWTINFTSWRTNIQHSSLPGNLADQIRIHGGELIGAPSHAGSHHGLPKSAAVVHLHVRPSGHPDIQVPMRPSESISVSPNLGTSRFPPPLV